MVRLMYCCNKQGVTGIWISTSLSNQSILGDRVGFQRGGPVGGATGRSGGLDSVGQLQRYPRQWRKEWKGYNFTLRLGLHPRGPNLRGLGKIGGDDRIMLQGGV
jgi:hypothetical protein